VRAYLFHLTCDHELIVAAPSLAEALPVAEREASTHGARLSPLPGEGPQDVTPQSPSLLAIIPGAFSEDAVVDHEVTA
jgi:hypothetical protein